MYKAAIDIGTNSTRLLIARCHQGEIIPVATFLESTRIGEGVGTKGQINFLALSKTLQTLEMYMEKCRQYKVENIRIGATSAVRDAKNKEEVAEKVYERTGVKLNILTGQEEAKLSFLGAISDLKQTTLLRQVMVLDIGGGSTELIYSLGEDIVYNSVNIGAVRLYENPKLLEGMSSMLKQLVPRDIGNNPLLVGVGGTVTSLVAINLNLDKYDSTVVHGSKLGFEEVRKIGKRLQELTLEERKKVKGLQPERADIIPFGITILENIMEQLNTSQIRVSEKDILYGMILDSAGEC